MTTTMNNKPKPKPKFSPYKVFLAIFLAGVAGWLVYFLLSLSVELSEREGGSRLSEGPLRHKTVVTT